MTNPIVRSMDMLAALFAILFMPRLYVKIAFQAGDRMSGRHRAVFFRQWLGALLWSVGAGAFAALVAYIGGRLHSGPIDVGKAMVCAGAWLGGLATWFALANAVDTFDRDDRLDTALRVFHFKLLFAPGLVLTLIGSSW